MRNAEKKEEELKKAENERKIAEDERKKAEDKFRKQTILSIKSFMDKLGWSAEKTMATMNLPEEDRQMIRPYI